MSSNKKRVRSLSNGEVKSASIEELDDIFKTINLNNEINSSIQKDSTNTKKKRRTAKNNTTDKKNADKKRVRSLSNGEVKSASIEELDDIFKTINLNNEINSSIQKDSTNTKKKRRTIKNNTTDKKNADKKNADKKKKQTTTKKRKPISYEQLMYLFSKMRISTPIQNLNAPPILRRGERVRKQTERYSPSQYNNLPVIKIEDDDVYIKKESEPVYIKKEKNPVYIKKEKNPVYIKKED